MKTAIPTTTTWVEPVMSYLEWLRAVKRAEGTIYQHSYQLRRFAYRTGIAPGDVTLDDLIRYLASLEDLGAAARRLTRQVLRGFFAWGEIVGRWPVSPAKHIPPIKAPQGIPRPAPEHSVKIGLHTPDDRTRLMILLAVRVGMRCIEICQVRTDDLRDDLLGRSLIVRGKGGKMRLVPISDEVAIALARLPDGWVFPGRIDGHLSASRVSELISEALPPGVTAHMLRHRYGTRAYQLGGRDIRAVQKLLGHAYVSTTQLYTDVDDDAVRRAALAAAAS